MVITNKISKKQEDLEVSRIKGWLINCFFEKEYFPLHPGFVSKDGRVNDSCLALLAADYLVVKKKIGFRNAHHIASNLSHYLEKENKMFYELTLKEYNQFNKLHYRKKGYKNLFEEDIINVMRIPISVMLSAGELGWENILK